MEKKKYVLPELEISSIRLENVLSVSGNPGDTYTNDDFAPKAFEG